MKRIKKIIKTKGYSVQINITNEFGKELDKILYKKINCPICKEKLNKKYTSILSYAITRPTEFNGEKKKIVLSLVCNTCFHDIINLFKEK